MQFKMVVVHDLVANPLDVAHVNCNMLYATDYRILRRSLIRMTFSHGRSDKNDFLSWMDVILHSHQTF